VNQGVLSICSELTLKFESARIKLFSRLFAENPPGTGLKSILFPKCHGSSQKYFTLTAVDCFRQTLPEVRATHPWHSCVRPCVWRPCSWTSQGQQKDGPPLAEPLRTCVAPGTDHLEPYKSTKINVVCLQFVEIVYPPYLVWYSFSSRLKTVSKKRLHFWHCHCDFIMVF
jgi:hypothetical protein